MNVLSLSVFGRTVRIDCADGEIWSLLAANYGHMLGELQAADLHYSVRRQNSPSTFIITRNGQTPIEAADNGELLFLFEKDMTIELQKLRYDLYFLHSAALEFSGKALLLVGPPGHGKSTTTWSLLHHGFRYLSDELAPVNLDSMEVEPYPHSICLKKIPPSSYPLPNGTLYTSRTLHVPAACLPSIVAETATPLAAICFVKYHPSAGQPTINSIGKAEAAARLFANALNPLAHSDDGLDGAIEIARNCSSYELRTADLRSTSELITTAMKRVLGEIEADRNEKSLSGAYSGGGVHD